MKMDTKFALIIYARVRRSRLFNRNNVVCHELIQKSLMSIEVDLFPVKLLKHDNLIEYQFHINKLFPMCLKNSV